MGSSRLKMEMCEIQLLFMHFPYTQSLNLASSYAGISPGTLLTVYKHLYGWSQVIMI